MERWKHSELNLEVSNEFNNKSFEERKEIAIYTTNQQLLTIRQLIIKRKEQHKRELRELREWENNVAEGLRKDRGDK